MKMKMKEQQMIVIEWLIDRYQLKMYWLGGKWHGLKTGDYKTLDYHNKFTKMAELSIERQGRRPSGRRFLNKYAK